MQNFTRLAVVLGAAVISTACGTGPAPADSLLGWDHSPKPAASADDGGASTAQTTTPTPTGPTSGSNPSVGNDAGSSVNAAPPATPPSPAGAVGSGVPCDVATVLASKCTGCHSDPPVNGSLAGLMTVADLKATAKEDVTKNEAQLSVARMQSTTSPMPPAVVNAPATASDIATLQNWIGAGYPAGSCSSDGGAPPANPTGVFAQAAAFKCTTGSSSHNAGRDCLGCHAGGGGDAPQFSFGGTLYDGAGQPIGGAEIRLVDAQGNAVSVCTGANGTFHNGGGPFAAPAHVGARTGTSTAVMIASLSAGGCSSCHCTGTGCTTAQLHLP